MKIYLLMTKRVLCLLAIAIAIIGCTESIDESNMYTFTGETLADHLRNNPETFSSYYALVSKVKSSDRNANASSVEALLSARGNYTCFAPNNHAIADYLDTLMARGEIEDTVLADLPDSIARVIVFNSLIDNGETQAYASTGFGSGALVLTNMNDRYINISYGNDTDGSTVIYVNADSRIVTKDIEVENGYIHEVDHVISPNSSTISDLIMATDNLSLFGELIRLTRMDRNTIAYVDRSYEDKEEAGAAGPMSNNGTACFIGTYPEKRFFGYTAFVETDSVFASILQLGDSPSTADFLAALKTYVQTYAAYGDYTSWGDDFENENNWLYQFVAYHIVPERLIWQKIVIFANESGFNTGAPNDGTRFQTNVWDYYETLDPNRRLIKVTGIRGGKRLNRISIYDSKYKEIESEVIAANAYPSLDITINSDNGRFDNQALNGYYYPIENILLWTEKLPATVLNERIRIDICAMLPELMTNNHRRIGDSSHQAWYYTADYFEALNGGSGAMLNVSKETYLCYLTNYLNTGSWVNYQSDEFNIQGKYDFVLRLPPVPYTGTYEVRYGITANSTRGMAQIYMGTNPNNLAAVGVPIDLRLLGEDPAVGWKSDNSLTEDEIEELDKQLRNIDYMKGPKYFVREGGQTGRMYANTLRKIIYRGQMEAGRTYYLRFKSVLESTTTQFYFDYLEFVPKTIWAGDEPEDKW